MVWRSSLLDQWRWSIYLEATVVALEYRLPNLGLAGPHFHRVWHGSSTSQLDWMWTQAMSEGQSHADTLRHIPAYFSPLDVPPLVANCHLVLWIVNICDLVASVMSYWYPVAVWVVLTHKWWHLQIPHGTCRNMKLQFLNSCETEPNQRCFLGFFGCLFIVVMAAVVAVAVDTQWMAW